MQQNVISIIQMGLKWLIWGEIIHIGVKNLSKKLV
jgi:hypothetical protein